MISKTWQELSSSIKIFSNLSTNVGRHQTLSRESIRLTVPGNILICTTYALDPYGSHICQQMSYAYLPLRPASYIYTLPSCPKFETLPPRPRDQPPQAVPRSLPGRTLWDQAHPSQPNPAGRTCAPVLRASKRKEFRGSHGPSYAYQQEGLVSMAWPTTTRSLRRSGRVHDLTCQHLHTQTNLHPVFSVNNSKFDMKIFDS